MMQPPQRDSQPGRAPNQPDDISNYLMGRIFAVIGSVFVNGFPFSGRFKKSLRVGTGAATLAGQDGGDGRIIADGTAAGFYGRDRNDSTKFFLLYMNSTIRLLGASGSDLWVINATTGILASPAWTNIGSFANSWTSFAGRTAQVRLSYPGRVEFRGALAGGTTTALTIMATLGTTYRPTVNKNFPVASNGAYGEIRVDTDGSLRIIAGSSTILSLDGVTYDVDA